jgi:hypothetical protein
LIQRVGLGLVIGIVDVVLVERGGGRSALLGDLPGPPDGGALGRVLAEDF